MDAVTQKKSLVVSMDTVISVKMLGWFYKRIHRLLTCGPVLGMLHLPGQAH